MRGFNAHNHYDNSVKEFLYCVREKELDYIPPGSESQRSISFIELVKGAFLEKAAKFALNKESIQQLDNNLSGIIERFGTKVCVMEDYLIDLFLGKDKICISFNQKGQLSNSLTNEPLVTINLQSLVSNLIPGLSSINFKLFLEPLSKKEKSIINMLRIKDNQTVKLIKKGNKLDRAECEQRIPINRRLIDVMKESPFQDIEIKQESGKPVFISRIIKTKL